MKLGRPAKEKSNDTGFEDEDQEAHASITSEQRSESANNDRIVGNKGKVNKLHCVLVVVSLILFAVIPSLFYGHSFKITDKEHYKAVVALAASLFCIISLSFAKAYAFNMDKLKTVAEYTAMVIGASAVSFIASQLVSLPSGYRKG
ncbi:unnamed protein product [Arabis nemorensis]|uniref:Uncharacterized protein n=1 Tax=Arabis nemorensis TaxID=586526 RepID=A0A565CCR4_9BRAS|nr:unnamed protein product [Arabis nemorensis]